MFKMITTLFRAKAHDQAEAITDANAMTILRQQLRDASVEVAKAKRSVATVMAYLAKEEQRAADNRAEIATLESAAREALAAGKDELAHDAAVAIAELEDDHDTITHAIDHYKRESVGLKERLALSQSRLRTLERGRQIADATERTQRAGGSIPNGVMASLNEAEATLARIQSRHQHNVNVDAAIEKLSNASDAKSVRERLGEAGFGAAAKTRAEDVMARLKSGAVAAS